MSSPRVQKIFEAMPNQLRRLGKYDIDFREAMRWQGRADAGIWEGKDAAVIDLTDGTWATLNKRIIIIGEPASDQNDTAAMKTQSHAQGQFLDGSVRFHVYAEGTPALGGGSTAAAAIEYQAWLANVRQHLVGQLAAPTKFWLTAAGAEPTVEGVDAAGSTAAADDMGWSLPYGMTYPGGV